MVARGGISVFGVRDGWFGDLEKYRNSCLLQKTPIKRGERGKESPNVQIRDRK